jgi:hypothetical protein
LKEQIREHEAARHLTIIPSIGVLNATESSARNCCTSMPEQANLAPAT